MVPTGNTSPGLFVLPKLAMEQLSEAVGATQVTAAEHTPASAVWVMLAGAPVMTGSSSSVTVTLKELVVMLPAVSVAV